MEDMEKQIINNQSPPNNFNPEEIHRLKDSDLIEKIKYLTSRERVLNTIVLKYLWEINRRRLYSDFKHPSLFKFLVKELGYQERDAWQRINGMTFLKNMPECEAKIQQGSLNLGNINMLDRFFKSGHAKNREEKVEIINMVEFSSTSECEKILEEEAKKKGGGSPFKRPVIRRSDSENHRLHVCIGDDYLKKIQAIQGHLAHKGYKDLDKLLEFIIETVFNIINNSKMGSKSSISASVKKEVWKKANGKCQKCGSVFALEIDHCFPKALGGSSEKENLRLLCRSCNQRAAIKQFGQQKMDQYLSSR